MSLAPLEGVLMGAVVLDEGDIFGGGGIREGGGGGLDSN